MEAQFAHLPIVGIMHLWPGVTELVRAEILREVLLDLVVAEGLHGIPGTRAISAWKICIYLRSIWGLSASISP